MSLNWHQVKRRCSAKKEKNFGVNVAVERMAGIYIVVIFLPPPWGSGKFLSKLKNREEFDGVLHEKRMGKRGGGKKKKRVMKHILKYLYEA